MTSPYRGGVAASPEAPSVAVRWVTREPPLAPVALAAFGAAARALKARLLRESDASLAALRGVAGDDVMVVSGETSSLPWIEGACWLGRDLAAPSLLLPTTERPSVDVGLFERALSRGELGPPPLAVLLRGGGLTVVSMAEARAISRATLERWGERGRAT